MELIKNMLKYFLILLVIVFLAGAFMAGILFFFPNTELFNFKFVSNSQENFINLANANITKVNIESNNYDIVVVPNSLKDVNNNPDLKIALVNNYTGFANEFNNGIMVKNIQTGEFVESSNFSGAHLNYFKNGTEITLTLGEPTGIVAYRNSKIVLYMPENSTNIEYNLSTNKGKISFEKNIVNESKKISTGDINLSVASARGSFNLDNAEMSDGSNLNIKNYIGRVEINSEKIGNVNINSNSGNFTFKSIGYDGFTGGKLTVKGNNPYITVEKKVYGTLDFNTTTGFLKVDELLGDGIIKTENGIVRINKVLGGLDLTNNSGEITLNQIGEEGVSPASINITTKSGAINLGTDTTGVYALSNINSESGRVVVNSLYKSGANITTTKGGVKVNFASTDVSKNLKVTTNSGSIEINNIFGNIDARTSSSAKIKATFSKIGELSEFNTDGGEVELIMPSPTNEETRKYNLSLTNKTNKLNISIGSFKLNSFNSEKDESGIYKFSKTFPEDATTTNTIKVNTNTGKINIHEN